MLPLSLLLVLLGILLLWISRRQRLATGLPWGRVIYLDSTDLSAVEQPLYDPQLDLTGKPDYLVRAHGRIIPVEVKSSPAPLNPYPSHTLQLAAYCYLVEATSGVRPTHGVLKYKDRAFSVDYTAGLENRLLDVLAGMRRSERDAPDRSHEALARCRACGYRTLCDQRLG